jgi:hypothetical protein
MLRIGRTYGLLTTGKGWCFLRRNGGILEMTQMYGDFFPIEGFSVGAKAEGFNLPEGMTILKTLYFSTHLAETAPVAPFISTYGVPGQLDVPPPSDLPDPSPETLPGSQNETARDSEELQIIGGYEAVQSHQFYQGAIYQSLQFQPWVSENLLGRKTWLAKSLPDGNPVVLKLWDAWRETDTDQVQEAKIYRALKRLWGIYVPALLVQSPIEFYHALLIQHVKVILSQTRLMAR